MLFFTQLYNPNKLKSKIKNKMSTKKIQTKKKPAKVFSILMGKLFKQNLKIIAFYCNVC